MVLTTRRDLWLVGALVALATTWLACRAIARHRLGPPGFEVTIADAKGAVIGTRRAAVLFTPESFPGPPPGGSLVARGSFVARTAGVYTWKVGGSSRVDLRVDGKPVFSPRPGLVYDHPQALSRGVHAVEVSLTHADGNGAVVLAVRPPASDWGYQLVGPDEIVDAPPDVVARRFRERPLARIAPFHVATLATLLVVLAFVLGIGAEGRKWVRGALRAVLEESKLAPAILLAVLAIPMLRHFGDPGYYFCHEGESYTVRFVEYASAIRDGVPMGRWWPDPVLGRGYPFLCLYAPLLYILATPFLLLGVPPLATVKLISAALVLVGMVATYGIARRRASRPAALVAAALFTYAPYLQTDLWIRADIAESLGFACFPLALLALERALDAERKDAQGDIALLALTVAALGSCHNITAYFAVYFLTTWMIVRAALRTVGAEGFKRAFLGAALGLLMTVFYAIPAIQDAGRVWIDRVTTGYYHSLSNLVPIGKVLLAEPRWGMRTFLGLAGLLAVAAGAAAVIYGLRARARLGVAARQVRILALPALAVTLFALALATKPVGWFVIKYVPLAKYVQFPWRMFLFAACTAPLCAPMAVDAFFPSARGRWAVAAGVVVAVVAACAPQYGPSSPLVRIHVHAPPFLRSIETDYVTSMNEYLPKTVRRTVPRFGDVVHVIAGAARVVSESHRAGAYEAIVEADAPATLELNAHWFPGWRARVDGALHPIGPGHDGFDDGGLIRVRVPAGRHDVRIGFGRTPLRVVCDSISLAALFAALLLLGLGVRERLRAPPPT